MRDSSRPAVTTIGRSCNSRPRNPALRFVNTMRMKPVQKRFPDSVWRNFAACLVLAVVSVAVGQDLPQPRNHVEDRAGVISQNVERQLIAVLADLERKTGAQMIALTINTTAMRVAMRGEISFTTRWYSRDAFPRYAFSLALRLQARPMCRRCATLLSWLTKTSALTWVRLAWPKWPSVRR